MLSCGPVNSWYDVSNYQLARNVNAEVRERLLTQDWIKLIL